MNGNICSKFSRDTKEAFIEERAQIRNLMQAPLPVADILQMKDCRFLVLMHQVCDLQVTVDKTIITGLHRGTSVIGSLGPSKHTNEQGWKTSD